MRFADRAEAARLLAGELLRYKDSRPLALGVARGGAPMAKVVAEQLVCRADVVLVRKLHAPEQTELALGAVDEAGRVYHYGSKAIGPELPAEEVSAHVAELRRRRQLYSTAHPPVSAAGHTAIIIDDGIATGASMVAAIRAVRAQRPLRIVVAVPVAARSPLELAKSYADDVVCLHSPRLFFGIGDAYDNFAPVADSEVVDALT